MNAYQAKVALHVRGSQSGPNEMDDARLNAVFGEEALQLKVNEALITQVKKWWKVDSTSPTFGNTTGLREDEVKAYLM